MKIWKLIRDMMKSGYTLEIGPHSGGTGYYAQFVKDDECELCDECESPMRPAFWGMLPMQIHRARPLSRLRNQLSGNLKNSPLTLTIILIKLHGLKKIKNMSDHVLSVQV
jgi:hypothetical protein